MNEDRIETLIAAARPRRPSDDPAVLAALDELRISAVPRRHRRRMRVAVTAAVAAAALIATTGAGVVLGARTGWFTPKSSEQDTSEWLNSGATGFSSVVDSLAPTYIVYPSDATAKGAAAWIVESETRTGGLIQETGIRRDYEIFAQCSWIRTLKAPDSDSALRSQATDVLARSASWPALVATDGGGVAEAVRTLVSDARAGDDGGVVAQAEILCPAELLGSKR